MGMTASVRMRLALVCAASGLALTACSSAGAGGHGAGSCVQTISYEGKKYFDLGRLAKKKIDTTRAAIGAWVYCDGNDGNGEPSDGYSTGGNVSVLGVRGVDRDRNRGRRSPRNPRAVRRQRTPGFTRSSRRAKGKVSLKVVLDSVCPAGDLPHPLGRYDKRPVMPHCARSETHATAALSAPAGAALHKVRQ